MNNRFQRLGYPSSCSINAFEKLSKVPGIVTNTDTTLRLNSPTSLYLSSPSGSKKRKWSCFNGILESDCHRSSLSLGLGHSMSSSDSKESSGTVATVSSAKDTEEESSMVVELNFQLHLGNDQSPRSKKPVISCIKPVELEPKCNLQLSLSTGQDASDISTVNQNSPKLEHSLLMTPTNFSGDEGSSPLRCKFTSLGGPLQPLPVAEVVGSDLFCHENATTPNMTVSNSNLSSSMIISPKGSVTCTSGPKPHRSTNSKTCQFKGCVKGARGASGLCIAHGGGRRCQRLGCSKGAEGRTIYCKAHGGGRRCQFLGCTKSAEGRTDKCIAHGGGNRCTHEGCSHAARGKSGLCIRHGGGKRCQKENCTKSAEGLSGLCISHGGGRRCQFLNCTKGAQGSTMFCKAHGGGKRCTALGCTKGAEGSTQFCKAHGGGKRCLFQGGGVCPKSVHGGTSFCVAHGGGKRCTTPGCTKSARGRTNFCVRHGGGKRCKFEGCSKSAQGSTDFCKAHGGGKRCSWGRTEMGTDAQPPCDRFARGKSGLCSVHGALVQDKRVHGGGTIGLIENPVGKLQAISQEKPDTSVQHLTNWVAMNSKDDFYPMGFMPFSKVTPPLVSVSLPEGRVHGGSLMAMLSSAGRNPVQEGSQYVQGESSKMTQN